MKIAVTGGSGYLGYHVAKGFNARNLSRSTGFDVTKREDCQRELPHYDVVIHMAAMIDKSETQPDEVFEVNVQGTLNVIRALKEGQTLIFTSTKDVYDSVDAYGVSKRIAEKYVGYYARWSKIKTGIFRLSTTYAPATAGSGFVNLFVESIQNEKELTLFYEGKQVRDFLYVTDLIEAFRLFLHSSKRYVAYDIGGGQENACTLLELAELIGRVTVKEPKLKFSDERVPGQKWWVTNTRSLYDDFRWKPEVSLEAGIREIARRV